MKRVRRPLLVMHPDERFRERVRQAGGTQYLYRAVSCWEALAEAIHNAPPAAVVVVDPYVYQGREALLSPQLRALLAEFPSIAVVAAIELTAARVDDLRALGKWGVAQVISLGHDDTPQGIAQRLRTARSRPLLALLERVLPVNPPGRMRVILEMAVDLVAVGGQGEDLSQALYLSRRTLHRWCASAGLPPPRQLLAWIRVLLAAELLDDPGRTILGVGHVCGYSSDSGLRRITQKYLGRSPAELRQDGAFAHASERFLELLAETRKSEA